MRWSKRLTSRPTSADFVLSHLSRSLPSEKLRTLHEAIVPGVSVGVREIQLRHVGEIAHAVVARQSVAGADLGVGDDLAVLQEILLREAVGDRRRGEIAPLVSGREFRRAVGAERDGEVILVAEVVIHARQPRHHAVDRLRGVERLGHALIEARDAEALARNVPRRAAEARKPVLLDRHARHDVEVVALVERAGEGQRVLVEQRLPRLVLRIAVDALDDAGDLLRIGVLAVEEVFERGRVAVDAARNAQAQVLAEAVFAIDVGVEVALPVALLLVIEVEHRVVAVAPGGHLDNLGVLVGIEQIVDVAARDGPVAPHVVHQRQRRLGVARRHAHRSSVLVGPRVAGVESDLEVLRGLDIQSQTARHAVVTRLSDDALLPHVVERGGVLHALRTARERDRMVVHGRHLQDALLPVDVGRVAVVLGRAGIQARGVGFEVALTGLIGVDFELQFHELVGVHQRHAVGGVLQAERPLIAHLRAPLVAAARGDHDDAVGAAGAVNGRGGGILQHVDRHDVRRVERRGVETFERESVDHVERRTVLREGVLAADDDVDARTGFAFARGDLHAGDTSGQRLVERAHGGLLHLGGIDRGDRARQVDAAHVAVAHDHHFVDVVRVLGQRHVDHRAFADAHLLRGVAQHREGKFGGVVFDPDGVFALGVGRRAAPGSLFDDRHADHRLSRSVLDTACDLPLLLRIGGRAPAHGHQPQTQGPPDRSVKGIPEGEAGGGG